MDQHPRDDCRPRSGTPRLHVQGALAPGATVAITPAQAHHLRAVLRREVGDEVLAFNGRDGEWLASLTALNKRAGALTVQRRTRLQDALPDLWLVFAPLKTARLDYLAQKAVEMGAARLLPVITRRTQVTRPNVERLLANAVEAAEQCGLTTLPEVAPAEPLPALLARWPHGRSLVVCDEAEAPSPPLQRLGTLAAGTPLAILIGPEGGFDPAERAAIRAVPEAMTLSLGPRILRADTAAVAALALVQSVLGDWHAPVTPPHAPDRPATGA